MAKIKIQMITIGGDANSKYFHACMVRKKSQDTFIFLEFDGVKVEGVLELKSILRSNS